MIFIILSAILIAIGVSFYVVGVKKRKGEFKFNPTNEWQNGGIITAAIGVVSGIMVIIALIFTQIPAEKNYKDYSEQRAAIVACIEAGETGSEIYSEVTEFNSAVRTHKEFKNNIFIGIFTNKKIAENIEYIDITPVFNINDYKFPLVDPEK